MMRAMLRGGCAKLALIRTNLPQAASWVRARSASDRFWKEQITTHSLALGALIALATIAVAPAAAQQPTGKPKVQIEPKAADLGQLRPDETGTMQIKLRNLEDRPIRFTRAQPSCGCVSGSVTTDPVAPGDAATLNLSMQAIQNSGKQSKAMWVWAEGANEPFQINVTAQIVNPDADAQGPKIEVEPTVADLGYIEPSGVKEMEIQLHNVGQEPVEFLRVTSTCSCAVGRLMRGLTPPGESAALMVRVEARPFVGPIEQTLNVWYSDARRPLQVPVKAETTRAVRVEPFYLNLITDQKGEILLESIDDQPFRVTSVNGQTPDPHTHGNRLSELAKKHVLAYDLSNVSAEELHPWFLIETDHPDAPILDLRVVHPAVISQGDGGRGAFTPSPDRLVLGRVQPDQSAETTITLVNLDEGALSSVESADDRLSIEVIEEKSTGDGVEVRLRITPSAQAKGLIRAKAHFRGEGHEDSALIFVRVEPGA